MNRQNNPFQQDDTENVNIDLLAEEMVMTLKQLNNKEKPAVSGDFKQDHSHSSLPIVQKSIKAGADDGPEIVKREDPIKITPLPRKRHKVNSEYEGPQNDDSQFVDSISNRKITQFFKKPKPVMIEIKSPKQDNLKADSSQEDESALYKPSPGEDLLQENHPVVKNLREKISKKEKGIEELSVQVDKMREKFEKMQEEMEAKRDSQMNVLLEMMGQKYTEKIYTYQLNKVMEKKNISLEKKVYDEIIQKIQLLKNQKGSKKQNKGKNTIDQTHLLDIYGEQRQSYLQSWKKKLESEKQTVQRQMSRQSYCQQIGQLKQNYLALPSYLINEVPEKIFEKTYLPLYCRLETQTHTQVRVLNLTKLVYENMILLQYPKIMRKEKRIQFKVYIKDIFAKSQALNDENPHSIFTNSTKFSQLQHNNQEYIIMCRSLYEDDQPAPTLKNILFRYESLPQSVVKYIIKTMIRAHDKIRRELNHEAIILPENFIFNQRNDLKIDNWVLNEIYRFPEVTNTLIKDFKYLYFPPEYKIALCNEDTKSSNMGVWTMGVILFEMLFGKRPFTYSKDVDHEEFYMMNELELPTKPQVGENAKQLIKQCLCKPQNRISFEKALRHPFFDIKK